MCKCWPFNDMKTLKLSSCTLQYMPPPPEWELKCYRQLEESLEFPWNEVLNETWSDWQVCSLFHWASLSSCSSSCRGERYTRLFLPNQESMHVSPVVIFLNCASGWFARWMTQWGHDVSQIISRHFLFSASSDLQAHCTVTGFGKRVSVFHVWNKSRIKTTRGHNLLVVHMSGA